MGVQHNRVSLFGTLSGGADVWSCGFSTAPVVGQSVADTEDMATAALALFLSDFWSPSSGAIPSTVSLVGGRCQLIDTTGHVTMSGEAVSATPSPGGNTSGQLPPEVALVVSLRTVVTGPRGRGRMYLPPFGSSALGTNGNLDATLQTALLGRLQTFFNDWNADPTTMPVGVASNAGSSVATVNQIRLGNVFDSQRRRRNAIPESYVAATIT